MAIAGTPEAGVLERCHRNYAESFWQYLRVIPGAARRDHPDASLMRCDLPFNLGNVLFFTKPPSSPREQILEAREFFGPRLPWRVLTFGARASEVGGEATAVGLRPGVTEPGMLLDPIPTVPEPPPSLSIRQVRDAESLADFGTVWSNAFGFPRWVLPVALPRIPPDDPERSAQNRFLVGYEGRRPVACSSVTVTERVAGIASVGTVRSARRRGDGTALTWAAVDAGRALGAEVAYLAATSMGYPVYARMGFRRVAEYPSWHVPVAFVRGLGTLWTVWRLVRRERAARSAPSNTGPRR